MATVVAGAGVPPPEWPGMRLREYRWQPKSGPARRPAVRHRKEWVSDGVCLRVP